MLSGCLSRSFCSAEEKIFHKKENLSFKIALKKLGAVQKDKNKQGKYWLKWRRENSKWERGSYPESYIQADSQIHKMLVVDANIIS